MKLTGVSRYAPELTGVNGQMLLLLIFRLLSVNYGRSADRLTPVNSISAHPLMSYMPAACVHAAAAATPPQLR